MSDQPTNRRILLIDDNKAIHDDIGKVLCPEAANARLNELTTTFLGRESPSECQSVSFEIDSAYQGAQGLEMLKQARADDMPYAVAIVDMRMPPGYDGVETIARLWNVDPDLQVVICTAHTDCSWEQITERFGHTDNLLILKKPFDSLEVQQLACAMTHKWNVSQKLKAHTASLNEAIKGLQSSNNRLQHEIAERRKAEDQMRHNALHDTLTELPNRALLVQRLERCIARAKRHDDYLYAVLFLDVDNFKIINDSLGHRTGDLLLHGIAKRLPSTLRSLDSTTRPTDDTMARFGGDEFVVLLDGIRNAQDATTVADRITRVLAEPFELGDKQVKVTVSVGIAIGTNTYDEPGDILRDADTALYYVKDTLKGQASIFTQDMRARAIARMELEHDLHHVIDQNQLNLRYQPIICLESGLIQGFEALLRWNHPERGAITPDEFIPIAEENGLIVPIGEWVLHEACTQAKQWHDLYPHLDPVNISVNLSCRQLTDQDFLERIDRVLAETGLDSRHLVLEITESVMIEDETATVHLLELCKERHIEVHMDDFGTGYSSLSYLHNLPLDAIKLDRSFVQQMSLDGKHAATVQAVITLALNRGFKVIAEGVERPEHLAQLQALDCDLAQGYYFSKAVSGDAASQLLVNGGKWRRSA